MKRYILPFLLVSILTACPSPVLQWIDTPVDYSGLGRLAGPGGASIVSLSFGIEGEKDLPIGTEADISGKIPILVILPEGTGLTELIPLVKYIGKSVNPPSGLTGNFSSPVPYTVTGEDNSAKNYIVRVYEPGPSTKEIIRLTLDVSWNGGSPLGAEGIINQETGSITVTVPAGTNLAALTAHVTHTGDRVTDPLGGNHFEKTETETFTFSGNFSSPTTWTVHARDESTKTYTLRVVREKDSTKEITSFSLHIPGETDIIGGEPGSDGVYPILALVPDDSATTTSLSSATPSVDYRGAAISPEYDKSLNFNIPVRPVRYTVSAEDGTTRNYEVQIIRRHLDDEKLITGFYFDDPLVEGVIDQAKHTIALTVPPGTNLNGIVPDIYYKGAFVNPGSRQSRSFFQTTSPIDSSSPYVPYTVYAADGTKETYKVYVFTDDSIPPKVDVPAGGKVDVGVSADGESLIFVEFPTYIYSPTINIGYPIGSQVINTGDTYNYFDYSSTLKMIVIMPPANPSAPPADAGKAQIDAFYFTEPAAIGVNKGTTETGTPADPIPITVTVPYGTDLGNLTATVCYTGKEIAGHPGANPIKDKRSFNSPVDYTVNAYQENVSKTYRVTVEKALNPAKDIIDFSFTTPAPTSVIISALPNAEGNYPIDIKIPSTSVGDMDSLVPVITYTGAAISGPSLSSSAGPETKTGVSTDFRTPVDYTVTAEDTSTKTYTVTVYADDTDDEPEILGFYFNSPLAVGVVSENTHAITVTVPSGTNTRALTPTLYFKGVSVRPGSGAVNNFASPATYTVTGSTGKTKSYLVTVNPAPSSTKDITRFAFPSVPGAETVIGAVPDSDGTYPLAVWVPSGTPLDGLAPVISHTGASVNPPAGTVLNFNAPQIYTVIAEDGSAKTYKVTVTAQDTDAKILTSFVFNEVPLGTYPSYIGYVRAAGSIVGQTVTVFVPSNADITNLIPTLTYIGKSVTEPTTNAIQTANPLTGRWQDFTGAQTYKVNDQNNVGIPYGVQVIKQIEDNIDFTGEKDIVFADSTFNQQTGVITITANMSLIDGPYGWYVNGVKQVAVGNIFTLSVNGFTPGKHEIMVSGRKDGLHYTGKVYFTVSQ